MSRSGPTRGAVLLIVLVAMMFATIALTLFIERSSADLIVEARAANAGRLRTDAYSALETTLAVLGAFRDQLGDLKSPQEGWQDPLSFSDFEPLPGRKVKVEFEDESGKLPLSRADFAQLKTVFGAWGMRAYDAERCADALLAWTRADHVARTSIGMESQEYRSAPIPYKAPQKPLQSWRELSAIATLRTYFFDPSGAPNEYAQRMERTFSLLDYEEPNINAAVPEAFLSTNGLNDSSQASRVKDFFNGTGAWRGRGGGYFRSVEEFETVLGKLPAGTKFGVSVKALRIRITISEGMNQYQLSTLVSAPGGAKWPGAQGESASKLPFTVLEIAENELAVQRPEATPVSNAR